MSTGLGVHFTRDAWMALSPELLFLQEGDAEVWVRPAAEGRGCLGLGKTCNITVQAWWAQPGKSRQASWEI